MPNDREGRPRGSGSADAVDTPEPHQGLHGFRSNPVGGI